jgi:hypothetical protein
MDCFDKITDSGFVGGGNPSALGFLRDVTRGGWTPKK